MKIKIIVAVISLALIGPRFVLAQTTSTQDVIDKVTDSDHDGLSDWDEINIYQTDPNSADTDGDGYSDGAEVAGQYDPMSASVVKLVKSITISLKAQTLSYYLGQYKLDTFRVSSGKSGFRTPLGTFKIYNKVSKAWSRSYGLWMPFWMAFTKNGSMGIHELPYWPSGYREGANHLGTPVSHGCVRLGIGPAETLFNWTATGTPVIITE